MAKIESVALTVVPAYGRDYKSSSAAQEDWWNGKDFAIVSVNHTGGMYVSCEDLEGKNYEISIRYMKLRRITIVKNVLSCDGHPPGEFDPMGQTVYCDGSCKKK